MSNKYVKVDNMDTLKDNNKILFNETLADQLFDRTDLLESGESLEDLEAECFSENEL